MSPPTPPNPLTPPPSVVNKKKEKVAQDRLSAIAVANAHLVSRMVSISVSTGTVDTHLSYDPSFNVPKSLNFRERKEVGERIVRENEVIKRRIDKVGSCYGHTVPETSGSKKANKGNPRKPVKPKGLGPSSAGQSPRMKPKQDTDAANGGNATNLFVMSTRLGPLHVRLTVSRLRGEGGFRLDIYEPLSSRSYPAVLPQEMVVGLVGENAYKTMRGGERESKEAWREFVGNMSLVLREGGASVYNLTFCRVAGDTQGVIPVTETAFEFADPTQVNKPDEFDAASKLQAAFRGSSARLEVTKKKEGLKKKGKGRKGRGKSVEKRVAEAAEVRMIEAYDAQAIIAKHVKGKAVRKEMEKMKSTKERERVESEDLGATALQSMFRKKEAKKVVEGKKVEKRASMKIQKTLKKKQERVEAQRVVDEKRKAKAEREATKARELEEANSKEAARLEEERERERIAEEQRVEAKKVRAAEKARVAEEERKEKEAAAAVAAVAAAEKKQKENEEAAAAAEKKLKEAAAAAEKKLKEAAAAAEKKQKKDEEAAVAAEKKQKKDEEAAADVASTLQAVESQVEVASVLHDAAEHVVSDAIRSATPEAEKKREAAKAKAKAKAADPAVAVHRAAENVVKEVIRAASPEASKTQK